MGIATEKSITGIASGKINQLPASMPEEYDPEKYWDEVAQQISVRTDGKVIAGDDDPYYRYKRKLFLRFFNQLDFVNKTILEVGSGPGGNLEFLHDQKKCASITGVDLSSAMVELSKKRLAGKNVSILKGNRTNLPFEDKHFDIVFTSTVLQHNTNESQLKALIKNICRVSSSDVIIFERIEKRIKGHASNIGRPVEYYASLFGEHGFSLCGKRFLPIRISYLACGFIRKLFSRKGRKEGEPVNKTVYVLEKAVLFFTKFFDRIVPNNKDLGMLCFKRNNY